MHIKSEGFTLVELLMVIVMLGLLAVVAVPIYNDLSSQAKTGNEAGVAGGVQSGILSYYAFNKVYPASLDAVGASTACTSANPCFTTVLGQGGVRDNWAKGTATTRYTSPAGNNWTYNSTSGSFTRQV